MSFKRQRILNFLFCALIVFVSALFAASAAFSVYILCVEHLPVELKIDPNARYQTMEGFGMSAAWTFQDLGDDEEACDIIAQKLYGDDGMRLNVFRYNVGAGTKETNHGYMDDNCATESFFIAENYTSPQSFSDPMNYDFTRDEKAMRVFDKCLETGNIDTVVLFANSPHYLLTYNNRGNASFQYENNLPRENYKAFADYMLIIGDFFNKKLAALDNPPQLYISPVNEPQWKWGGDGASQEGCHFDPEPLAEFYDLFYNELCEYNKNAVAKIKPDFFESGNYNLYSSSRFEKYIEEFSRYPFFSELDHISVHAYGAADSRRVRREFEIYKNNHLANYKIHMSEFCVMMGGVRGGMDMGLYSASVMLKDLTMISASQWCWWLGVAEGGFEDGLLYFNKYERSFFTTKRYSAFSQFTRYISAGDVRIGARTRDKNGLDGMEVCAFEKSDGSVVAVIINLRDRERKFKVPKSYEITEATVTDKDRDVQAVETENFKLPSKSVTTLVLKRA